MQKKRRNGTQKKRGKVAISLQCESFGVRAPLETRIFLVYMSHLKGEALRTQTVLKF
jgi:hypothetical protein